MEDIHHSVEDYPQNFFYGQILLKNSKQALIGPI